jgi:hypothetical protein
LLYGEITLPFKLSSDARWHIGCCTAGASNGAAKLRVFRPRQLLRCELVPMDKRIGSCTAAIALTVTTGVQAALAQRSTCVTIQRGDTAARLAGRLAGDARYLNEPWFQIVDTSTLRVIAKRQYGRIRPGWRACIAEGRGRNGLMTARGEASPRHAEPPQPSSPDPVRTRATADVRVWWGFGLVSAILLAWWIAAYSRGRRAVLTAMTVFGERFVREFERPLMRRGSSDRGVQAQLRLKPHRKRLDILLAPHQGRTYPNLSDHRRNVEYDVGRVLRLLNDERFVGERLSERGRWVIVRCRFTGDPGGGR